MEYQKKINNDYGSQGMMEEKLCTKQTVINEVLNELGNLGSAIYEISIRLEKLSERAGTREDCVVDTSSRGEIEPASHTQALSQKTEFLRGRLYYCEQRIAELETFI